MTIQTALQAVTHNLPGVIVVPGRAILGADCYATLIEDVAPTQACLRLAISKALGIGIIVFGSILKLPQIATIIRHQSAWGISLSMYALEVVAYDISLAYAVRKRLPFSTYGENASLTVQNMVITLLIIWYTPSSEHEQPTAQEDKAQHRTARLLVSSASRFTAFNGNAHMSNGRRVAWCAASMAVFSFFCFVAAPAYFLSIMQALSIPISLLSKFPQIAELHRNKQCGHLSAVVVFAQFAGTLARVFTTITETGDWLLGIGFGLASVLNAVIVVQYVYYWNNASKTTTLPLVSPSGRPSFKPRHSSNVSSSYTAAASRRASIKNHGFISPQQNGNAPGERGAMLSSVSVVHDPAPTSSMVTSAGRHVAEKGHRMD